MKSNARRIAIVTVFAALYAIGVIFLAPISFGVYQVRLADSLLPLSMIFGIPSAIGFALGCVVSNVYGGLGIVDVIGGALANFVACTVAWYAGKKGKTAQRFLGSIAETIIVALIVGGYLSLIFQVPLEIGLLGVLVGSLIAINVIGFPIQEVIRRNNVMMNNDSSGARAE
jgi:uncharacterized membrane protein